MTACTEIALSYQDTVKSVYSRIVELILYIKPKDIEFQSYQIHRDSWNFFTSFNFQGFEAKVHNTTLT